jgi:hypothetical protein
MNNPEDVPPQPQLGQQRPTTHFKSLKPLSIIAAVFLIALVAGTGGYLLERQETGLSTQPKQSVRAPAINQSLETIVQPSSSPFIPATPGSPVSTNWQTYTNQKYSFSISYPPGWKYLEVPTPTYQTEFDEVWFTSPDIPFPPPQTNARSPVTIRITKSDPSINWPPQYFRDYKEEPFKLRNSEGKKISGISIAEEAQRTVIIANIGDVYILALPGSFDSRSIRNFEQILSTFKFLKTR